MTDNEILKAMSDMLEPIRKDIQEMKSDIRVLKEDVSGLKEDVSGLKQEMEEVKFRVKKIEITQETLILPLLNDITNCYISTFERYKTGVEEHEEMKQRISVLETVVKQHSSILQMTS